MRTNERKELLNLPEVVEEIKRHLWIESEKAGYDIGFDSAADDWFNKYSQDWMRYHLPGEKADGPKNGKSKADPVKGKNGKATAVKTTEKKTTAKKSAAASKRRRAKSYRS
ncbi:MAG: hypothetical protein K8S27_07525 [Candidatus Omnitrophica bacterium]|nr:hypothetical protein [Candidatus Omnitrophota bacterium]